MKIRKSLIALAALPLFVISCDKQELPYDLEGVTHTFGISVDKVTTADLLLGAGPTDGNYKVALSVPEHMGDYTTYFKEAELLCVYTPASGNGGFPYRIRSRRGDRGGSRPRSGRPHRRDPD